MGRDELVIIALRLVVPLLILRYQVVGGITAMLLDGVDVILIEVFFGHGFRGGYHQLDKMLDTYYLTLELIVALRWTNPWARRPAVALFAYRLVGVVLFEVWEYFELARPRLILFLFPNMFENWWPTQTDFDPTLERLRRNGDRRCGKLAAEWTK
jgi:hypothetical protein